MAFGTYKIQFVAIIVALQTLGLCELKINLNSPLSIASKFFENTPISHVINTWPIIEQANGPKAQENVYSDGKEHAMFITIVLSSDLRRDCVRPVALMQQFVDEVVPKYSKNAHDEVIAGVGLAPDVYEKFGQGSVGQFGFQERKGSLGVMPHTAGHIFVHAKSNNRGNLRYLAEKVKAAFPNGCLKKLTDIYSFEYRDSRDLSGFIDGTQNVVGRTRRHQVAVNRKTGGSFCLSQRWIHDFDFINSASDATLEGIVGRTRNTSEELRNKPATSHVARMTSGPGMRATKPFEIVRQSMPFGVLGGDSGLYFIAFANSTDNFDFMLDRMVGRSSDGLSDSIMRLSRAISGKYWYFPSVQELKTFQ